jgi:hypothetical protein
MPGTVVTAEAEVADAVAGVAVEAAGRDAGCAAQVSAAMAAQAATLALRQEEGFEVELKRNAP